MKGQNRMFTPIQAVTAAIAATLIFAAPLAAQDQPTVAEKLAEALELYLPPVMDLEKGIAIAQDLLKREDLLPQDSIGIYAVLSLLHYVKGEDYRRKAFNYLDRIADVGPCVVHLPQDIWPAELRRQWYEILKAKDQLACPEEARSDIKTIAIMEFDNFSVGKYQEKLGPLGKGLADFFEHDFGKISSMKVIERDKINFVLKELELQKSGAVDAATAVRAGKILGARYMVFGSITQLDDRQTRMVVRVVSVETSEIIASVDKEGAPYYTKIEKELVEELAKKLDVQLSEETAALIKEGGTESLDATAFYAKGLEYMDRYDYKKAYEFFKKAYELDKDFVEAKRKMEIYQPLAG
ncbi:MAG: CsgG/HfaB family protein [Candidatus Zixiibacteriota bacterium]